MEEYQIAIYRVTYPEYLKILSLCTVNRVMEGGIKVYRTSEVLDWFDNDEFLDEGLEIGIDMDKLDDLCYDLENYDWEEFIVID